MCGRYTIVGVDEITKHFHLHPEPDDLIQDLETYNASPSQILPVIVEDAGGERVALPMQWGLVPRWRRSDGKPGVAPINARAETLLEKPMFRGLTKAKRCIVPANGFYEWRKMDGRKQPYYLTSKDGELWGFAGLYDLTHDEDNDAAGSFTIITTSANPLVAPLHERMPVILRSQDEEEWVSREVTDPVEVEQLLQPYPADAMRVYLSAPPSTTPATMARTSSPQSSGDGVIG